MVHRAPSIARRLAIRSDRGTCRSPRFARLADMFTHVYVWCTCAPSLSRRLAIRSCRSTCRSPCCARLADSFVRTYMCGAPVLQASRTRSGIRAGVFGASWTFCVDVICAESSSRRFAIGALLWFAWAGLRKRSACSCYVVFFFCLAAVRLLMSASLVWRCGLAGPGGTRMSCKMSLGGSKMIPKMCQN